MRDRCLGSARAGATTRWASRGGPHPSVRPGVALTFSTRAFRAVRVRLPLLEFLSSLAPARVPFAFPGTLASSVASHQLPSTLGNPGRPPRARGCEQKNEILRNPTHQNFHVQPGPRCDHESQRRTRPTPAPALHGTPPQPSIAVLSRHDISVSGSRSATGRAALPDAGWAAAGAPSAPVSHAAASRLFMSGACCAAGPSEVAPPLAPICCCSHAFSAATKPTFGRAQGLAERTSLIALEAGMRSFQIM